ncbi:putative short chain oxidoreductase [Hyaloscypha hepaticicola]|uniref:Putative short chain oxidoreductase n=1 Tax=Hyaloscypha hepaticicola TaxID=2082293 RepID=A0A2J6Q0U4_9HELO|nr:putative short chain oxidoreductase [Hyaloscypha hepaticicola]
MASYLITGCSRGLGLAITSHLLSFPTSEVGTIIATSRSESPALKDIVLKSGGRVKYIQLDATNEASIKTAATQAEQTMGGKGLDLKTDDPRNDLEDHFNTNVLSVHHVTPAFIPLLQKGGLKKVANITTTLGSISRAKDYNFSPTPAYKISKAAMNMLTVQYALGYADQGFTIFVISPGWLRTDLGGKTADLSPEQGAIATIEKIMSAGKEDNGNS